MCDRQLQHIVLAKLSLCDRDVCPEVKVAPGDMVDKVVGGLDAQLAVLLAASLAYAL